MTNNEALKLHNEDEVYVTSTGETTTVLDAYRNDDGTVLIETTYRGFTVFQPNEID